MGVLEDVVKDFKNNVGIESQNGPTFWTLLNSSRFTCAKSLGWKFAIVIALALAFFIAVYEASNNFPFLGYVLAALSFIGFAGFWLQLNFLRESELKNYKLLRGVRFNFRTQRFEEFYYHNRKLTEADYQQMKETLSKSFIHRADDDFEDDDCRDE